MLFFHLIRAGKITNTIQIHFLNLIFANKTIARSQNLKPVYTTPKFKNLDLNFTIHISHLKSNLQPLPFKITHPIAAF